jgi:hypothetical protein
MRQVIHLKAELVTVGALLAGRVWLTASDSGVVNEEIQAIVVTLDRVDESAHLRERAKVCLEKPGCASDGLSLLNHFLTTLDVAAVHDDVGSWTGESEGNGAAQAAG